MESHITGFYGDESLKKVTYKNLRTGEEFEKDVDGVFIFIGYEANTDLVQKTNIRLNQWKEVLTDDKMQTNIEGVYAAGDCRAKQFRQITTAVSDGTVAALNALNYIHNK